MSTYLMNPMTGSVATLEEWQGDFVHMSSEEWGGETFEAAGLIEVVPNREGEDGYDPDAGEWRSVED